MRYFELKRKAILGTIISCVVLALSACGSSDNVVTSKVGNITEKELSKELKQKYGESTFIPNGVK